jgi:glycosyltransferase involved in cell wall biosynthesis
MLLLLLFLKMIRRTRRVVFLIPHGGYTPGWWTFTRFQRISKRVYQKFIGTFLINRSVDGLRSVSEWETEETVKSGVRRDIVETIPNGIEKEVYSDIERLASDRIRTLVKDLGEYVVQVGRIHPIKNQLTTIRAVAKVPGVAFAIAGPVTDEAYKKTLDEEIRKLGIADRIHFLGVVDGVDKYYLLRHSLANTHMASWESYCNAVHESMSQGCVCIVAKDTALEELIRDGVNGYAVPVSDAEGVADKIRFVLHNRESEAIAAMRKRNIDFTAGHSWDDLARRVEAFYTKILLGKRS